jgi:hypothetical protein
MVAMVAVPAVLLLAARYLTDEAPPDATRPGRGRLQPGRVSDHEAGELSAAPGPAGTALG